MNNTGKTNPQNPHEGRAWSNVEWIEESFEDYFKFSARVTWLRLQRIQFIPDPTRLKIRRPK